MNDASWKAQEEKQFQAIERELTVDGKLMYAARLLERAARNGPDLPALIYQDQTITYQELYRQACLVSRMLVQHYHIKPGDRVLVCFENSPEFYVAYFGAWQAGAVVAPINTFLKEHELVHIVNDARPACILAGEEKAEAFRAVSKKLNGDAPLLTEKDFPVEGSISMEECAFLTVDLPEDEMSALLYTSGTTGLPKGVMLSSRNILSCLMQGWARLQLRGNDRIFGVLPLFHVFAQFACVWGAFFVQATIILVPKIDRRKILAGLAHKPTIFLGVPALYGLLCLMKNAPIDSVNYFVSGGDALPDKIRMAFALLYRRKIASGYGLTETAPLVCVTMLDEHMSTDCVGRPMIGVNIKLVTSEGQEVAPGSIGTLWVSGDNVMRGYYNAPEATKKVLRDGWFDTGDLAYLDSQGRIVIAGREKDLIIHKGFNIYPQEIENVITNDPNVLRVGVVGIKDGIYGEEEIPVAFVQLRTDDPEAQDRLKKLCMEHLAAYKVPKTFIISTQELPLTATGKVNKKVLRDQHAKEE